MDYPINQKHEVVVEPPWLQKARQELTVSEIQGAEANPRIIQYFKETTFKATSDEVPWCSAFACAMMEWVGIPSPKSCAARAWLNWGVRLLKPTLGCVVILQRTQDSSKGHVGFYVYETESAVAILGGNQGNKVSIKEFSKLEVIDLRLPSTEYWDPFENVEASNTYS